MSISSQLANTQISTQYSGEFSAEDVSAEDVSTQLTQRNAFADPSQISAPGTQDEELISSFTVIQFAIRQPLAEPLAVTR